MSVYSDNVTIKQIGNKNQRYINNKRLIFFEKTNILDKPYKIILYTKKIFDPNLMITLDYLTKILENMDFIIIKEKLEDIFSIYSNRKLLEKKNISEERENYIIEKKS